MASTDEGPTFIEGDEEVQYLYVSLPNDVAASLGPGTHVIIEGLGTEQPVLRPGPHVGSSVHPVAVAAAAAAIAASAAGGSNAAASGTGGGAGDAADDSSSKEAELQGRYIDTLGSIIIMQQQRPAAHNAPPEFKYLAHTEKQLAFKKQE